MRKGRFWDPQNEMWLHRDMESPVENKPEAGIFTYNDWLKWGNYGGFEFQELPVDEALRLMGQPELPGLGL